MFMEKRNLNTQEAQHYLGVRRRFFESKIAPLLVGKGVRAGTSIVFERSDLDAAWDQYKAYIAQDNVLSPPPPQASSTRSVNASDSSFRDVMRSIIESAKRQR